MGAIPSLPSLRLCRVQGRHEKPLQARAKSWSRLAVAVSFIASPLHAQLVADGATNTLSNVTNNITGDVTVGTNGSFTLLVLSDNALLTNSANGIIGRNTTAKSNEVQLLSATARWRMGGNLLVGSNGAFSRLVVSNGAVLNNNNGRLGFIVESSNNVALITGGGSLWSNANTLTIGNSGRDDQMIVSDGGWVVSQNGDVGGNASASNNLALITGSGSVWSNVSSLRVGALSPGNRLVVEAGGLVHSSGATVGQSSSASNNEALVTGPDSLWMDNSGLTIGQQIGFNRLVVSNGAVVRSPSGVMGSLAVALSNQVVVTGTGSIWSNQTTLIFGGNSAGNRVEVSDGGWLACRDGWVGSAAFANNNTVTLTGSGSGWNNFGTLFVGDNGSGNVLIASNGATLSVVSNLYVGANSLSTNNRVVVDGGTLRVTNAAGTGLMDVRRGTNVLNAGLVEVDQLLVTNSAGKFELNGGTLFSRSTVVNNGQQFRVGNVVSPATLNLTGNGTHTFFDNLTISQGGTLTGNGNILGNLTVLDGGKLSPGPSIGKIILSNSLALLIGSTAILEISKNGSVLTNDQVHVTGRFTSFAFLLVTNIGPTALAAGDRFQLFPAGSYGGSVSDIKLPPLPFGLNWANKLLVDGSIEVLAGPITYLKSSSTRQGVSFDFFGFSVAASGDTVVVGEIGEDNSSPGNSGAAYIFVRNGTNWSQQAKLKASNPGVSDSFGSAVAISGDTVVVTAIGEDSNATGVNGDQIDNSASGSGAAYVFVRTGTSWSQQAYLKASNTGIADSFGKSVAVSGDTILVGANLEDSNATGVNGDGSNNGANDSGAAYVFVRAGTSWSQQAYLKASNANAGDFFGESVAVSGDTVVVGSRFGDSVVTNSGVTYVFVRNGTNWAQQAQLGAGNAGTNDQFGKCVALSGNTLVVGALGEDSNAIGVNGDDSDDSAPNSGAAYVFVRDETNWTQQAYLKASNTGSNDIFGAAAAISGETIVIGAYQESSSTSGVNGNQNDNLGTNSGAAYVFVRSGTNWNQQFYLKASNTDIDDHFAIAVAISGSTVVVGAISEDSGASGINGDDTDNTADEAGAAYVFDLSFLNPPVLNIAPSGVNQVTVSWTPPTPGFGLQESLSLSPVAWSNSPSGQTNPVTLPVTGDTRFFRLFRP